MSWSIDLKGHKRSEMKNAIVLHNNRSNKKEAEAIMGNTESRINPSLSRYNVQLIDEPDLMKNLKDEAQAYAEAEGNKKFRTNRNAFITGNLTLSYESLSALGWKYDEELNALPITQQDKTAIKNVKSAYTVLIQSAQKQPNRYGKIRQADLHFDETSPHVDFVSSALRADDLEHDVRFILNGTTRSQEAHNKALDKKIKATSNSAEKAKLRKQKQGMKRGQAGKEMQDHLGDFMPKQWRELAERLDLRRGDAKSEKVTKKAENERLRRKKVALEAEAQKLVEANETLATTGVQFAESLTQREQALGAREKSLTARELEIDKKDKGADKKLSEASKLQETAEKLLEQLAELKKEMAERWNAILEKIREGALKPAEVEKVVQKYKDFTADDLDDLSNDILELTKGKNQDKGLSL